MIAFVQVQAATASAIRWTYRPNYHDELSQASAQRYSWRRSCLKPQPLHGQNNGLMLQLRRHRAYRKDPFYYIMAQLRKRLASISGRPMDIPLP